MINLTQQEREKFALWLKQDAETDKGMIEQLKKINAPEVIINKKGKEMIAKMIVSNMLIKIEDVSLGGKDVLP